MIDVLFLSQETVDVNSQCAFAVQHCGSEPHLTFALDNLLQLLLRRRLVAKTTDRGLDFAHAFEYGLDLILDALEERRGAA